MNYNRFVRNPEVKNIITIFFLLIVVATILNTYMNYKSIEKLNGEYIKQNTYLVGKLSKYNIDEKEIVDCFLEGGTDDEYEKGYEILKEYGYKEDTDYYKVSSLYSVFYGKIIESNIVLILSLSVLLMCICKILWNLFSYIGKLTSLSNKVVEEEFNYALCDNREGDLALLTYEFNIMSKRIKDGIEKLKEEKNQLKDYLSDISHQLKTPLSSLIMFNQIMLDDLDLDKQHRKIFLEKSNKQLEKMEWLILNLLKIGRLEADVIEMNLEEQPIIYTIKNSIDAVKNMATIKNQELILNCNKNIIVKHDSEWLGEAITNIVKNCIEHTAIKGKIEIIVEDNNLYSTIKIIDNGEGMTKEEQRNIFKRFYKGENSINPKSIGIGMSLSKAIIEKNNGFIKVNSKLNEGTTFIITFYKGVI